MQLSWSLKYDFDENLNIMLRHKVSGEVEKHWCHYPYYH